MTYIGYFSANNDKPCVTHLIITVSGHSCKDTVTVTIGVNMLLLDFLLIHLLLQVAVDIDYARSMYELHKKVNASEMIVGWSVCFYYSLSHLKLKLVKVI